MTSFSSRRTGPALFSATTAPPSRCQEEPKKHLDMVRTVRLVKVFREMLTTWSLQAKGAHILGCTDSRLQALLSGERPMTGIEAGRLIPFVGIHQLMRDKFRTVADRTNWMTTPNVRFENEAPNAVILREGGIQVVEQRLRELKSRKK